MASGQETMVRLRKWTVQGVKTGQEMMSGKNVRVWERKKKVSPSRKTHEGGHA